MRRATLLLTGFAILPIVAVTAQEEPTTLEAGMRARFSRPCEPDHPGIEGCGRVEGTVASVTADSVVLHVGERRDRLAMPRSSVTQLEVSSGHGSRLQAGAITGVLVGALAGGLVGAANYDPPCPVDQWYCFDPWPGRGFMGGALVGGLAGGLVGGVIGALIKVERWEPARLGPSSMYVASQGGGRFELGVAVGF